jgi:hypothetical protein
MHKQIEVLVLCEVCGVSKWFEFLESNSPIEGDGFRKGYRLPCSTTGCPGMNSPKILRNLTEEKRNAKQKV